MAPFYFSDRLPKSLCALNSLRRFHILDHHHYPPSNARLWSTNYDSRGLGGAAEFVSNCFVFCSHGLNRLECGLIHNTAIGEIHDHL